MRNAFLLCIDLFVSKSSLKKKKKIIVSFWFVNLFEWRTGRTSKRIFLAVLILRRSSVVQWKRKEEKLDQWHWFTKCLNHTNATIVLIAKILFLVYLKNRTTFSIGECKRVKSKQRKEGKRKKSTSICALFSCWYTNPNEIRSACLSK